MVHPEGTPGHPAAMAVLGVTRQVNRGALGMGRVFESSSDTGPLYTVVELMGKRVWRRRGRVRGPSAGCVAAPAAVGLGRGWP